MSNAAYVFESLEPAWLERRRAERVEARLKVAFKELMIEEGDDAVYAMEHSNLHLLAYQAGVRNPADVVEVQSRDISINGLRLGGNMQLCGGRSIAAGTFVELEITLPFSSNHIVRSIAVIKWSKPAGENEFEAGLAILIIDEEDVQQLQNFIEQSR